MAETHMSVPGLPDLERRALSAWFKTGGTDQPKRPETWLHEGKFYIVLSNVNGVMAVYRVRNDDVLKRLKRPPKDLIEAIEGN